jgi:excisionase family DNA binding protein
VLDRSLSASRDPNVPPILTLKEVAQILRCSKAHVANVINGHVKGLPRLTHFALGRRKLVRREWLDQWMEANKVQC